MPVLRRLRGRLHSERPLDGVRVAACLHVTAETANLMLTLVAAGANAALCSANPLSAQDDVAAALVIDHGIQVRAVHGEDLEPTQATSARFSPGLRRSPSTTVPIFWSVPITLQVPRSRD